MRRFSLGVAFVISALLLASMSANAEEVQYENPELQVKFNLKEVLDNVLFISVIKTSAFLLFNE